MRQIEENIYSAIRNKENAVLSNTAISFNGENTKCLINLHGHIIAEIDFSRNSVKLNNCGFESNITKSRMNIVLDSLNIPYRVRQRNRKWEVFNIYKKDDIRPFKNKMALSL